MDDTTGVVHTVEKYTTYADRILKSLTLPRDANRGLKLPPMGRAIITALKLKGFCN